MRRTDEQRGDWKEWRRRRAWDLSQQGWSQNKIAEALGVTEGAVSQWMKVGREQGEEGLCGKIAAGPAARLRKEQLEQLPSLLMQGVEAHGFAGEVWTTERVAELISKQFGVSYQPAHVSRLLKVIKYSVQQPIERATQRDEKAITTWKEERWPGYAPELNPQEGVWNLLKRRELKNLCCQGLPHLRSALLRAKERLRHRKEILQSCFLHALGTL